MFRKYPAIVLVLIIATIGAIFVSCNKESEVVPNTITYADSEAIEEMFNPNGTIKDDVKIEGVLDSSLFYDEELKEHIFTDIGCLRVGYVMQDLSEKLVGYDILDGAKILSASEIEEKVGILRENYDSMCFIEGNSTNPNDFLVILKVNPLDENYESKISNAFACLFNYREELFKEYSDDEILSARYLSSKITKGNDYILFFSIGNFKSDDVTLTYNYYEEIGDKLLNGYYYVLGDVYGTSDSSEIKNYEDLISNVEDSEVTEDVENETEIIE